MTSIDLSGRTALVTGAAQGLGAGMAQALAAAGARVMLADIQDAGADTASALGDEHGFVRLDVTEESDWERAVASAVETLGGLDILVNNAGIEVTDLITEVQPADIRQMLEINVLGTTLGLKHGLRAMRPVGLAARSEGRRAGVDRLRQAADRLGQGTQGGRGLAGPAPLQGGQGPQE